MISFKSKKSALLAICLILLLCAVCGYIGKLKLNNKINSYLQKNHSDVDINEDNFNDEFSILDSDISKNDVILTGEGHAIKTNYTLKFALLKYFNQKDNVRYFLCEMGYAPSCLINEYIESGNEAKLKLVYNNLKGTASWNKEEYNFWIELRKYNLALPESKRIKVIGIDIEHQINTACEYLNSILPCSNPPNEIESAVLKYKNSYKSADTNSFVKAIEDLQSDIKSNSKLYSDYLGSNYFDFSIVVDNIVNCNKAYAANSKKFDEIREKSIYSNFKRVYSHFPVQKYFGEFGMEHVYQRICDSYMGNEKRFAMFLNGSDSPVKGKVLSIAYGYENCFYSDWQHNYMQSKCGSVINDINIIDKYSNADVTIFKLNGYNSPFYKKTYFVQGPYGGCTTDYFKYVMLIRNSKGASRLGKLYSYNKKDIKCGGYTLLNFPYITSSNS